MGTARGSHGNRWLHGEVASTRLGCVRMVGRGEHLRPRDWDLLLASIPVLKDAWLRWWRKNTRGSPEVNAALHVLLSRQQEGQVSWTYFTPVDAAVVSVEPYLGVVGLIVVFLSRGVLSHRAQRSTSCAFSMTRCRCRLKTQRTVHRQSG